MQPLLHVLADCHDFMDDSLGRGNQTLSGLQKGIHVCLVDQARAGIHEAGDRRIAVL
jgi:hypothetical protein